MSDYREEYASECCGTTTSSIEMLTVQTAPGCTSYYHDNCDKCGNPCWKVLSRLWDCNEVEVLPGDILETPNVPFPEHAERYHAVMKDGHGLEIRDTGSNNLGMWSLWGPVYNLGHYTKNLDKLTDDYVEYYFENGRNNWDE